MVWEFSDEKQDYTAFKWRNLVVSNAKRSKADKNQVKVNVWWFILLCWRGMALFSVSFYLKLRAMGLFKKLWFISMKTKFCVPYGKNLKQQQLRKANIFSQAKYKISPKTDMVIPESCSNYFPSKCILSGLCYTTQGICNLNYDFIWLINLYVFCSWQKEKKERAKEMCQSHLQEARPVTVTCTNRSEPVFPLSHLSRSSVSKITGESYWIDNKYSLSYLANVHCIPSLQVSRRKSIQRQTHI